MNPELVTQKIDLGMKRPALHILIKVTQVGIVCIRFEEGFEPVAPADKIHQCALTTPYVARYRNVLGMSHPVWSLPRSKNC